MARIYLTGRLAIEGPKGIVDEGELPGVQGRVALASLVMARGPISRVSLANTVWGETSLPAGWDKALNSIISKLRAQHWHVQAWMDAQPLSQALAHLN